MTSVNVYIISDCGQHNIGTIDGTLVKACVPVDCRKGTIAQNMMCMVNFNMMFTFVYTGWEGFANDARVFTDTLI